MKPFKHDQGKYAVGFDKPFHDANYKVKVETMKKFLIVIPARKGSSFKGKNLYPVNGVRLIQHTLKDVDSLSNSDKYDIDVVVTTDDHYVKAYADKTMVKMLARPTKLANDRATLDAVMYQVAGLCPSYDYYICLQPTSPLRTEQNVLEAIQELLDNRADSLLSVVEEHKSIWKLEGKYARPIINRCKNRQEVEPVYIANGAIFITSSAILTRHQRRTGGRVALYVMTEAESVDVHDRDDIALAEYYLTKGNHV